MVYVSAVLEFFFLILAILTYVFIFMKFVESRRKPKTKTQKRNAKNKHKHCKGGDGGRGGNKIPRPSRQGTWQIFCNSSFYVYVILTLNIILLNLLPQMVYFFLYRGARAKDAHVYVIMLKDILVVFSDILDAVIYIMLDGGIRKILLRIFCSEGCYGRRQQECGVAHGKRTETELQSFPTSPDTVYGSRGTSFIGRNTKTDNNSSVGQKMSGAAVNLAMLTPD